MLEKVIFIGNLGADPELRYTEQGRAVCNFSVAVNRRWNDANGETHEATKWVRVSTWGKLAEICNQYLAKGRQVFVEGRLADEIRVWQDQNGNWRASYELTAYEVKFLGSRGSSDNGSGPEAEAFGSPGLAEDEIPF